MSHPLPSKGPSGQTYLVTAALPYANGDIHLGHMVEAVQTDIFVRFQRLRGNKVLFSWADDTHGTPIELSALKKGVRPEELVAEIGKRHVADYTDFSIGYDIFHSTNSPENRHYAEHIFSSLQKNGLIVEREIEQYFCDKDQRFLPDRFIKGTCPRCKAPDQYGDVCESCGATYDPGELTDRHCMLCGTQPRPRTSTHLFVELAKCRDFLHEYVNAEGVLQSDMRNFVNGWINDGLRQWCISRDAPYFGFPIPGYPDKYFYVWLDAPIGYISATAKWCADNGADVNEFWGENSDTRVVHFIGKDIVYFHTLFWPVMLKNGGFKLPWKFFVHGFLTVQGEKMSKTRGTFVLARDFLEKVNHPHAAQCLRFYFGAKLSANTADIDLNLDDFRMRVNTSLVNNIGNLHNRTFVFNDRFFGSRIPDASWDERIRELADTAAQEIRIAYEAGEYKIAVEKMHILGNEGNKYYQDSKPWELVKSDPARAAVVIVTCANLVKALAVFLKPIVPGIIQAVERQLGRELVWDDHRFSLRNHPMNATEMLLKPLEAEHTASLLPTMAPSAPSSESAPSSDGLIDIDTFKSVQMRIATVVSAVPVEKSNRLLKLQVEIAGVQRQVIAGIAQHYKPEELIGTQVVVVANLKPAMLMGEKSEGMILAAKKGKSLVLLQPQRPIAAGAEVS